MNLHHFLPYVLPQDFHTAVPFSGGVAHRRRRSFLLEGEDEILGDGRRKEEKLYFRCMLENEKGSRREDCQHRRGRRSGEREGEGFGGVGSKKGKKASLSMRRDCLEATR